MDLRGTEESFKALSGKNISILHIATHGFYWTETEARQTKDLDFLMMGDNNQSRYVEDKALTRSGTAIVRSKYYTERKSFAGRIRRRHTQTAKRACRF